MNLSLPISFRNMYFRWMQTITIFHEGCLWLVKKLYCHFWNTWRIFASKYCFWICTSRLERNSSDSALFAKPEWFPLPCQILLGHTMILVRFCHVVITFVLRDIALILPVPVLVLPRTASEFVHLLLQWERSFEFRTFCKACVVYQSPARSCHVLL